MNGPLRHCDAARAGVGARSAVAGRRRARAPPVTVRRRDV